MEHRTTYSATNESALQTNKVLRNTYSLLAMTLMFSAVTAFFSTQLNLGMIGYFGFLIAGFISLFIVHKKADTAQGLMWTFIFTGCMGMALGPILNRYLAMSNGGELIMQALGGTALIFFGLSAYALSTKKDFSFMGGFLSVGILVVIVAAIANIFFAIPAVSLALSAAIVMIMSGFILYDTSRIVHGGETNYIRATVSLYLNIYNLFINLLALLGFAGDD
ncbi:Bax inhibitor-1/YccA family protein [Psychrobium sp. 1_MG-2023]|uniref:Bax inhibitor-1/YccA family protein n=1 Tax=Psychrobium sp. 1_MG-2023 TaxID=3062624 RepID=UPI000C32BDE4|nr:Bax inhibitor-1/YccA family protein [Psychrobium sp. 1_MG-2023]MDP2562974.1 Bax inhibitor-1/YccA family protein [Psychrobium sp. 1_MG-2023]PKF59726.1 BAX inhibitor protein [Alteromonadales bacterium alter-6D02]